MLYRPKFCSPAMTAEQKVFEYSPSNEYTFSCVCDGNEKIKTAELLITEETIPKSIITSDIYWGGYHTNEEGLLEMPFDGFPSQGSYKNYKDYNPRYLVKIMPTDYINYKNKDKPINIDNIEFPEFLEPEPEYTCFFDALLNIDLEAMNPDQAKEITVTLKKDSVINLSGFCTYDLTGNFYNTYLRNNWLIYKKNSTDVAVTGGLPIKYGIKLTQDIGIICNFTTEGKLKIKPGLITKTDFQNPIGTLFFPSEENISYIENAKITGSEVPLPIFAYRLSFESSQTFILKQYTQNIKQLNMYPINNKGEYNLLTVNFNNPQQFNQELEWKMVLTSESGQKISTPLEKTMILLPNNIIWENTMSNEIISDKKNYILNSNVLNTVIDFKNLYPIQYWYYEIYDFNNKNKPILIYKSNKIFSQEIGFIYDNFLNNYQYKIKLYITDTINRENIDELILTAKYDILESSALFDYTVTPFDTGVYLKWSNINALQAYAKNGGQNKNNISSFIMGDENENVSQNIYSLNDDNTLKISDLSLQAKGMYGCLRLLENQTYCTFTIGDKVLKIKKTYQNDNINVQFDLGSEDNIVEDTLDRNAYPACWYAFYWRFIDNEIFINRFYTLDSKKIPVIGEAVLEDEDTSLKIGNFNEYSHIKEYQALDKNNINDNFSINTIEISGNKAELAYLCILSNQDDGKYINNLTYLNIQPYWSYKGFASVIENGIDEGACLLNEMDNFLLSLNFEEQEPIYINNELNFKEKSLYLAGDPSFLDEITDMIIKRKKIGETYYKTIATLPYSLGQSFLEIMDYGLVSGETYEYALFPVSNLKYQSPIFSNQISVEWDKWVLMICDETEKENEFVLDQLLLFDLNIKSGSMSNNNDKTIIKNFTPYPRVQSSPSCYWSGNLSGLLGFITPSLIDYAQSPEMLNEFKLLSLNNKRKFLKDRDGNLFEIELSGQSSIENTDNLIRDLKTKTLSWVEVGDAKDASITLRDGKYVDWILTEHGYGNPLVSNLWDDSELWLDNGKYWTEGRDSK